MELDLFQDEWGKDKSPVDNTEITTTILYFSKEELKEFKKLCKEGMKKEWPNDFQEKANMPDFLLKILREKYDTGN